MRFSIFQESKIGGRKSNQDRMGYCYTREALMMLVADGMGGHVQGDMAAQITLQTVGADFQRAATPALRHPLHFLQESLENAQDEIVRYRAMHRLADFPRTTVVACVIQHGHAYWAHVGDSRLYWMRGGSIIGQTRDHSRVQSLVDQHLITPLEALTHPDRNKVYNCLGSPERPRIELSHKMRLAPGDTLLLCSDGLWSSLSDTVLANAFAAHTVMRAVPDLVQVALNKAGAASDNVTALAMTWEGTDTLTEVDVSTVTMPVGTMTTTIRQTDPTLPVGVVDALSDDEIEKTIREIRESIRRSNQALPKE
jgi:serine/threonine protein phosphatase PrpC